METIGYGFEHRTKYRPRRVFALPPALWPKDCSLCFAPLPHDAERCLQCGLAVHAEPLASDEVPSFSVQ